MDDSERAIRDDQTRRIMEWLRGRTGAHGGGFTCADDVVAAIEREFPPEAVAARHEGGGDG